jgi:exopolyphosphatase/guanosine-5'-triphosphate,3'-diphosphate pyrophosphatase
MCEAYQLTTIKTIATAAVRKAKNGDVFVKRALEELDLVIDVIPGEMEAAYDYLGVINTLDITDALMMDIGGGSAEFVLIKDRKKAEAVSLPFGSIDLAERFSLSDDIKKEDLGRLVAFLEGAYAQYPIFEKAKNLPLVGVGGTIRNIGRIHRRMTDHPLDIAHNYYMYRHQVKEIYEMTSEMNYDQRRDLKGLSKGRTDIFVGACRAVYQAMKTIDSDKLIIANSGLRNGVIFEYLGFGEDNIVHDVHDMSLSNVMHNYDVNLPHAVHMYRLCKKMYADLKPLHILNDRYDKVIKTAALLHDCGIKVDYTNHHEHSFNLILNSPIYGVSHRQLLLSAFAALNHRINKKVKVDKQYENLVDAEDKKAIDLIGLLLQIGEQLDRSMDGAVRDVDCVIKDDRVILRLDCRKHSVFTDMILDDCGKKFKRVFGRELAVEASLRD